MMVEFNLEEIKKLTDTNLSSYHGYGNRYHWVELEDITKNQEFKEVPLFDVPLDPSKFRINYKSPYIEYVCFGKFTYHQRKSRTGRILFEITPRKVIGDKNNHCWMNLEQLNYWIQTMKEESGLDFFYRIQEKKTEYVISYDFKDLTRMQMRYVLFWTRYAYEYPASFVALDAILLKQSTYPEETLQNLLTLVSDCQTQNRVRISFSQNLTVDGKFVQKEELQRRLNQHTRRSVNQLFGVVRGINNGHAGDRIYGYKLKDFYNVTTIKGASWINNMERFKIYDAVYKLLKEREIHYKEEN